MSVAKLSWREGDQNLWVALILIISLAIAIESARPYAGGWNDGSRLATVECLVDYHTLAIDRSIFVQVPPGDGSVTLAPYPNDEPDLLLHGTGDKLLIQGHFYSDKSPVPALLMAGLYQIWQWCTGATARQRPDSFCYWMTVGSSGLAYALAVFSVYQLGGVLRLKLTLRLAVTTSFALATVALPYVRHVNNHIVLLGVATLLFLGLARLAEEMNTGRARRLRLLGLGCLAGLGYTIDLGAGPALLLCTLGVVSFRCRRPGLICLFILAAIPWLALHHLVNFKTGGTLKPANAVPEYFAWPGCTFNPKNMTGSWQHVGIIDFLAYAADLLVGKRGFLGHNLPVFLALPALAILLPRRLEPEAPAREVRFALASASGSRRRWRADWPELLSAAAWCAGTWLLYALTSNNSSGQCCSIRWFVPLLAPCYYILAVFLREFDHSQWAFFILSGWGGVMAGLMWWQGPWMKHMVPQYWPLQGAALLSLIVAAMWRRRRLVSIETSQTCPSHRVNAA
jgi:hypothetical protein